MQSLRTEDPAKIGDYAVLGRLGQGAMGMVFLARSPGGRPVAVKVVRPELADDPRFTERFRHEVASMRAVGGFWTAAVVDADPDGLWLATEYVPGPTLFAAVATHGPLPVPALRALVAGLAEALAAIHGAGLVHRDLKPANVLLAADGPRVIDFGIAKALEGAGLTATGMFVGTPGFLSPEQIEGRDATPASDVFALGAVLAYAATGDGPFGTGDAAALMYRAVHAEPDLGGVPPEVRALAARCLDRTPSRRPTPAGLLAEIGTPETAEWLPGHVRAMITEQETELGRPAPRPPTRPYTKVGPPLLFGGTPAKDRSAAAPPQGDSVPPGTSPGGGVPSAGITGGAQPSTGQPGVGQLGGVPLAAGQSDGVPPASGQSGGVPLGASQPGGESPGASHPAGAPEAAQPGGSTPGAGQFGLGHAGDVPQVAGRSGGVPPGASQHGATGAGQAAPGGGRAVFRVWRLSALVLGGLTTVGAVVCGSISQAASAGRNGGGALLFFAAFVLLAVPAVRFWWIVVRPRPWIEVSGDGLTIGRGTRARLLSWAQLARVRVVENGRRPWLVVWPHDGARPDVGTSYAGGFRVFPVGHERRKAARLREVRELRAALGWYGRAAYDPSP